MRLTLRTLLAYLDDILEPAEAKEIGSKIAESGYATSLVSRIKDVVRRRRVGAPEVSGPGSSPDANLVAEYLDNTLPPEKVADLERVCLESDSHLAEVAACHQVLTLVLGERVEIPKEMRERMYSLGVVPPPVEGNGTETGAAHVPKVAGLGASDLQRNTQPGSGEVSLEDRLPEALLPRKRSWVRVLPYIVGILVLGAWGYLTFNDEALTSLFATNEDEGGGPAVREVVLPAAAPAGDQQAAQVAALPSTAVSPPDLAMTPKATVDEGVPIPEESAVPPVEVIPAPDEEETGAAAIAAAEDPKIMPDPDALKPPDDPPPAEPEFPPPHELQYVSTSGVLLRNAGAEEGWILMARRALLYPDEEIASPHPFDATLIVGEGGKVADVIVRGGTRVRSLGSTAGGRFGFDVAQGHLVVRRKDTVPADVAVSVQVVIRKDAYTIELLEPGTIVGVEVIPVLAAGENDMRGATEYEGGIALADGSARLSSADGEPVALQPGAAWMPFASTADTLAPAEPLVSAASWLSDEASAVPPLMRRYATRYEDEFIVDQPISQSIRPVVKDRRPPMSELATQTLALCGSFPGLVDALSSQHEESRIAAILGLKAWLPLSPDHGPQLQTELQNRFREAEADAIDRLLWGYGEQHARNQIDSEDLLNWLGHDEIAIRELAFFHVYRLTDRRYDYRPNDPSIQREAAIDRWWDYVRKQGALISN